MPIQISSLFPYFFCNHSHERNICTLALDPHTSLIQSSRLGTGSDTIWCQRLCYRPHLSRFLLSLSTPRITLGGTSVIASTTDGIAQQAIPYWLLSPLTTLRCGSDFDRDSCNLIDMFFINMLGVSDLMHLFSTNCASKIMI